jgi:molybdate transport system regulatory protein
VEIRAKINIVDERGEPFMGPGVLQLLERVGEHKSINRAARQMNLSYVKALNLLNRLEADLGRQILIRRRGGNDRGGTQLTPFGKSYVLEYSRLEKKIRARVEKEFRIFQERVAAAGPEDARP